MPCCHTQKAAGSSTSELLGSEGGRENSMGLNPEMMDLVLVWLMSLPWDLLGYPQMTKRGKGHRASSTVVEKRAPLSECLYAPVHIWSGTSTNKHERQSPGILSQPHQNYLTFFAHTHLSLLLLAQVAKVSDCPCPHSTHTNTAFTRGKD